MEIKGAAVKSIPEFVKAKFTDRYDQWLQSMPESSRAIFSGPVFPSGWYSLQDAGIVPTRAVGDVFFAGNHRQGAWEAGRYSADVALQGIYKFFVKAASPAFIIGRASKIFKTYYQPCEMQVVESSPKNVVLRITEFPQPDPLIEYRIAGWMERGLEISGCKGVNVSMLKSMTRGQNVTEFSISWL
jgi:hypothetical protein